MDIGQVKLGEDLVAKAELKGGKLVLVLEFAADNVLNAAVDSIEKAIPGDQTGIAAAAKLALKQILGA